jgi:hypothetical protein
MAIDDFITTIDSDDDAPGPSSRPLSKSQKPKGNSKTSGVTSNVSSKDEGDAAEEVALDPTFSFDADGEGINWEVDIVEGINGKGVSR